MNEHLKKLNDDHFNEITKPINNIYVDLDCFLDQHIGALLYLIVDKYDTDMAQIYLDMVTGNLDAYDASTKLGDISMFNVPITNKEVEDALSNPGIYPAIVKMSPRKTYYQAFFIFINTAIATNRRSFAPTSIEMMVGTRHPLPQEMKNMFTSSMLAMYPDIRTVTISDCRVYDFDKFLFTMFDHYAVEDIQAFADKHKIIFEEGNADYKSVHAFPYLFTDIGNNDLLEVLENTEYAMQLLYDFRYVHKTILRE